MRTFADAEYAHYRHLADNDLRQAEDQTTADAVEHLTWQQWEARQKELGLPRIVISDTPETRIPF